MTCNNWDKCKKNEMEERAFPVDNESLYKEKIYDNQSANNTCYETNPIKIIENFGNSQWSTWISVLVIILLAALLGFIFKDSIMSKDKLAQSVQSVQSGGFLELATPSEFNIEPLNFF